ncbi:VOC family protein [Streptomyces meridianus]|uniref:VOC family protein n=1 Tax=Streptomyces meridianus TaxID=2938945 RepID=A0ABT0X8K9_9ACTN|nr:VOC family protein [Streptomyces meridianus]MCM2578857.1 VOC family protein [Streptomyces meridianus]
MGTGQRVSERSHRTIAGQGPHAPWWVSLMVHDLSATQDFYGGLFGWTFAPGPRQLGPYVRAMLDGHVVAGLGRLPDDRGLLPAWTPYPLSGDADLTAEEIRFHGGTVAVGPLDTGDAGRLVIASDPTGAVFGVWQPHEDADGAMPSGPGTPVWNELTTPFSVAAGTFYASVFGFEVESVAGARPGRLTLLLDGRPVAALREPDDGAPGPQGSHWRTYFEVEDADGAAARVVELGGRVLRGPSDGPAGRTVTAADPDGAVFALVDPANGAVQQSG